MPKHKIATSPKDGDLTIETLYSLGFDRELVDFAVYHSNDDLFDAVDNLLEFRQRPAAKQKPPVAHTNPVQNGWMFALLSRNEGYMDTRASSEVIAKTNFPMERNKEIIDLSGNDIKTERTPDPSTHKSPPNDTKPNVSLMDALLKVEETVKNDLLTEQIDEIIDPIENDLNSIDDQGVGVDNHDYSGISADIDDSFDDDSFDDDSFDDDYADDEDGKLQNLIKNDISGAPTTISISLGNYADNIL
ncbi:hypothetical protein BGAL_0094g00120 [Botrytis galanthina]|uniref:UBA domain-containing protein n=1 Tax=Botrytis galanthina TaxID=278940 RepID=A0A4S8R583_9HELO|nr:hypothetical protein BGAL_0094g00120 [Botrytis galanthina]